MKTQNRIATLVNSRFYPLLLFLASFVFVTLFSRATSFLYVFEGADPSVFKQMGLAVLRGKTLYIDYFDNKGCILYFIQALGLWLGGDFFILLMQAVSLTVTLVIWDKMLALYRNENQRLVCLAIALVMLLCFYSAGDQTQEWCLPFISYPLLVHFRAYKTNTEIRPLQMFIIGFCFGIITFIQINNACAFLGFIAYLWIQYLLKKDFGKLFQSIGCFVAGWMVIAVPCMLYFYIKASWHGVYEMTYASLLSNFEYIGAKLNKILYLTIPYYLFLTVLTLLQIINLHKEKDLLIPMLISLVLFVATFGTLGNMYYLMAILPLCIVGMMTIRFTENKSIKSWLLGLIILCMAYYSFNPLLHFVEDLVLQKEKELVIYEDFHHCIENIPEKERDSIFNYNLLSAGTSMMQHEKLMQCNRVLFTSLVFTLPTLYHEETNKPFTDPKWIMFTTGKNYVKNDINYILENYELSCSFRYDKMYSKKLGIGDVFDVYFYRRKD